MGSATGTAVLLAVLVLVGLPPASSGSVLPQIEDAIAVEADSKGERAFPTLRKHYLEVAPGVFTAVKGKRERRQVRHARLRKGFSGDRAAIYGQEGFPTFRHRENDGGVRSEHWTYLQKRVTFVFQGDRLIAVRPF